IFCFRFSVFYDYRNFVLPWQEGRARRHERKAGCDGRSPTSVRRMMWGRTAKACGPGTPGLVPSCAGDDPRSDGDSEVMDTGESAHNAVKTIAQGRPGRSG